MMDAARPPLLPALLLRNVALYLGAGDLPRCVIYMVMKLLPCVCGYGVGRLCVLTFRYLLQLGPHLKVCQRGTGQVRQCLYG